MLVIDSREPKGLQEAVKCAVPGSEVQRLDFGDYLIFDTDGHILGIERKDISDLLHSMSANKLPRQLGNLNAYDYQMLLIEGCWAMGEDGKLETHGRKSGWTAQSAQMILLGLQEKAPSLTVLHTSSIFETVKILRTLENRATNGCVMEPIWKAKLPDLKSEQE